MYIKYWFFIVATFESFVAFFFLLVPCPHFSIKIWKQTLKIRIIMS